MLVLKAYSNERAPTTKTNGEGGSGLAKKGRFRTALQMITTIGSLALSPFLVPWYLSVLVVGFMVPVHVFVEHEIHEALDDDSFLPDVRQAWKCAEGTRCVADECLKEMVSIEPKIELPSWILFVKLVSMILRSPGWIQLVQSALRHN